MKILVTGGTGFTGKALVHRLLQDGHHVVALDFQEGLKTQELRDWGAEVVIGTVTDKAVVDRCMKGVEVVHHLAAAFRQLNVPNSYYWDVNVGGTKIVLEAAWREKVKKFVYCSTCGVHGNVDNPPGDENGPINAADYYQQTKYEAEPLVRQYQEKGMSTTILRPAAIYGPGDPERFFMIFKRVNKGVFPMFGNGKTLYHPLYIDHLIDAHVLAQEPGRGEGEAYLIADEHYVEIETLVKKTAAALGVSVKIPHLPIWPVIVIGHICEKVCKPLKVTPPIFPRRVDWFRQNRAFSIEKAKRDLGYHPTIDLDEGLRRTAAWYRQEGYL
ncbi:NAD-dependent epimerase/dehydratase family protein [Desulfofustis limnaeus]|jgi:nucleoside-diphosphate-sugar epimerase|uniref:Dihydroflavonol-4-reductase n=1 Tax=Desulfofustis limnaeus TaxID=2740163 RepID=A0ABN6M8Z4_9BACT|nr:NAD-dependent epimerase/dehydratase family protein [Desulfofustis limnaeus]MDX9895958.1 NAD-dependent epimerase/dehydratase family protein [Desulfofustis sp.]BDD89329.1 dihydroflavonol-4-reductase [Desulfofustis limnaeus]